MNRLHQKLITMPARPARSIDCERHPHPMVFPLEGSPMARPLYSKYHSTADRSFRRARNEVAHRLLVKYCKKIRNRRSEMGMTVGRGDFSQRCI